MPPVHGCPVTLRHGWEQLHIRVSSIPASATTYLTTWPYHCLPGRPSANDAAVFQRPARPNVARVVRVSVAPRARRVPRSRFHHQQMGVVFQLPVTDLQSLDELEKSLQQSCIIASSTKSAFYG
jgi:hypothetical protein